MTHPNASIRRILPALFGLVAALAAHAVDETDHRYLVFGSVLRAGGQPVVNQRVRVLDGDTVLESATTDGYGRYHIELRLRDRDAGRQLTVATADERREIAVDFPGGEAKTLHGRRVDFRGAGVSGDPDGGRGFIIPPALYYIGAVIAVVFVLALAGRSSRRRARAKAEGAKPHKRHRKRR